MEGTEEQQRHKKQQLLAPFLPIRRHRFQIMMIGAYQTFKANTLSISNRRLHIKNLQNSFYEASKIQMPNLTKIIPPKKKIK